MSHHQPASQPVSRTHAPCSPHPPVPDCVCVRRGGNKLAYNPEGIGGRLDYTQWWNQTGILCLQLESIHAYTHADQLALPGVDLLTWGPADTRFVRH